MIQRVLAAALIISGLTVFTSCSSDNDDNPSQTPGGGSIVGNWCSDVSGKTFAKWNYGKTWQNTEFKADGTGSTRIYYTYQDKAIGCEKIDFTYTAANGVLTMKSKDREDSQTNWQLQGDELRLGDTQEGIFTKTTTEMVAKFDTWSKSKEVYEVPQPAKYTIFVYGNAGGFMDNIIEFGFWERTKEFLKDHNNVRVVCMYKYGKDQPEINKPFKGKYAQPGDIVWFELNDQTDLNKIKEEGMQAIGMGEQAKQLKICNPNTMRMFLEFSSLQCPAEDYILAIWGHGSGFDAMNDVPGKYDIKNAPATRGVMTDEWVNDEWMDMYEMYDAMKAAGIDHFNTLMFHNCFMGNIESMTQARNLADYIFGSAHVLSSDGRLMTEFVRGMVETGDPEKAAGLMFERSTPEWQNGYLDDAEPGKFPNGDYKMIRMDKFQPIIDASKQLCDRILALYPTQKEAIDRATASVYRVHPIGEKKLQYNYPFFDIANYAQLLAKETGDDQLKTISTSLDQAFKDAFVHYRDVNNSVQHLDHYTLSVCLLPQFYYTFDYKTATSGSVLNNYNEGYEKCDFHKLTGWGNWLNTNTQSLDSNPECGSGGQLK